MGYVYVIINNIKYNKNQEVGIVTSKIITACIVLAIGALMIGAITGFVITVNIAQLCGTAAICVAVFSIIKKLFTGKK